MDEQAYIRAYLSGYADGEGCFCVTFNRSRRHKFGWEIRPSFSVSQNMDRSKVLNLFQDTFGCGSIRPDRSDKTLKYEVRSISELAEKFIPHFQQFPLLSSKRKDFERFAQIAQLMRDGEHLKPQGFACIVELSDALNSGGKKRYIRLDITWSADKGIVYATGNSE